MKKVLCALLIVMLVMLCACGSGGGGSKKFTVEYVGTANIMSPNPVVKGEMDGQTYKISLVKAFKDCTVTTMDFASGSNVVMTAVDGGSYLAYEGGLIVTMTDGDGKTIEVTVKEGSVFDAETDGDTIYLLPPK